MLSQYRQNKNSLHQKLSEKAESSQTLPFSDNFCDTIDSQQVTQILTLKNGQKVI
jgi:hypothetical protein